MMENSENSADANRSVDTDSAGGRKCVYGVISYLDCSFVIVVIGGLVVGCWWSTWSLMDHFVFPDDAKLSSWTSFSVGAFFSFVFIALQDKLVKICKTKTAAWCIATRLHVYLYSVAVIKLWRGSWGLLWVYAGQTLEVYAVTWIVTCVILWIFRISYSMVAAPLAPLPLDLDGDYYYVKTRYYKGDAGILFRTLEITASVLLQAVVALVWCSVWGITDHILYPDDITKSALASFTAAASLVLVLFVFRYPAIFLSKHAKNSVARLVLEDTWFLLQHLAAVQHWRGFWLLYAIFILPGIPPAGPVIGHLVAFLVLTFMFCGYAIAIAGMTCVSKDGENVDGSVFQLPTYFTQMVRHFTPHSEPRQTSLEMDGIRHTNEITVEYEADDSA
ncbi:uncharacterized protein [Ptychodera flava]|uniref:uncharacterized protein n=1 Tax=Ptychodera flava TaxID=63121 RepID=UPI00396A7E06